MLCARMAAEFDELRGEIAAIRDFLPADMQGQLIWRTGSPVLNDVEALLMERLMGTGEAQ